MEDREGYTIELWDNIRNEWQRSTFMWNRRYTEVRNEFDALCADAKNAEMLRKYRIVNTHSGIVYDEYANKEWAT